MSKENLTPFLEKCLKEKVTDYELSNLTQPGDNFGSVIQKVSVKILRNGKNESIELVAKQPVTNEFLRSFFQPEITCVKENYFYSEIIPVLMKFQQEYNIPESEQLDIFIKYYGSRLSLNENSAQVDDNAILLLQNIKSVGFENGDRLAGLNEQATSKVLKELAKFHGLSIALRLLRPNVFKEKIRPYLNPVIFSNSKMESDYNQVIVENLDKLKEISNEYRTRLYAVLKATEKHRMNEKPSTDETPYTTILHKDIWINNIMMLKDSNGNVTKVKIYDFQLTGYNSFASDLLFFLFTTVEQNVLKTNFKKLIKAYYEQFYDVLKQFGCDLANYTYDLFYKEIKDKAKWEALHIFSMIMVTTADSKHIPELNDINEEYFLKTENVSELYFNKLRDIALQYEQLGFI